MLGSIASKILNNEKFNEQYVLAGVVSTAITIYAAYMIRGRLTEAKDGIPMVPYVWPIFGSTLEYRKDENKFTKETAIKYGPVYRAHLFGKIVTIVGGGGHAEEVFTHPQMSFIFSQNKKFEAAHFFLSYPFIISKDAVQDSIIKELNPNLKHYSPLAFLEFKSVMGEMLGDSNEPATLTDFSPVILKCIAQACVSVFLGPDAAKSTSLPSTFMGMFHALSDEFNLNVWHQVFPWYHAKYMKYCYPKMKTMKKHRMTIRDFVEKEIDRRFSQGIKGDDLLQYVIDSSSVKNNNETVESLTTYIVIMFLVGVLTTFGSITGIIKLITADASLMKNLKEEQEQAIDDEINAQNIADISSIDRDEFLAKNITHIYRRLSKLDSFIREFFRYGTRTVAHAHTNIGDQDIVLKSGVIVRPGEEVYINLWDVHQQSKKQNTENDKSMDEFQAFRHLGQQTPSTQVGEDFLLFGMGKRACPGRWFAIHQIKGVVTCLIRNYEITALKPGKIEYKRYK